MHHSPPSQAYNFVTLLTPQAISRHNYPLVLLMRALDLHSCQAWDEYRHRCRWGSRQRFTSQRNTMAITTTKPLRIGIIGSGSAAKLFASAIKSTTEAELWSVYSRQRELSTELAAAFGAKAQKPAHDDLQTMLRDPDLDAVIVASPDGMHARQVLAAAAAGKHVLVEKPMALDLGEADRMIAACKAARVCLAVGYRARWHDGHRRMPSRGQPGEEVGGAPHEGGGQGQDAQHRRSLATPRATPRRAPPREGRHGIH